MSNTGTDPKDSYDNLVLNKLTNVCRNLKKFKLDRGGTCLPFI